MQEQTTPPPLPSSAISLVTVPPAREIIRVDGLSKTYKLGSHTVNALNGISLSIFSGEIVAITGASGSGKSTLLQLIGGLDKPSQGDVIIDNVKLSSLNDKSLSDFRNATIGFIFQFFYLQPFLKLAQNIEIAGLPSRMKKADRNLRITQLADDVGLTAQTDHYPKELSGGQIQRAAIARAIFNNPKIILADEPTGNLDSENTEAILKIFEGLRTKYGTTIVMVTHDDEIAKRADRIIVLKDGSIV